jgi:hypothetical protein
MSTQMKKNTYSRRRFLRDIGVSAAAVPFVYGLESLYHKANAATVPKKRLIVMYTPNGMLYANWRLPQAGADIDLVASGILSAPGAAANLNLSPLAKNASKLLILDRLSSIGARQMWQDGSAFAVAHGADNIDHPGGHQKGLGNLITGTTLVGGANNFGNAGLAGGISVDQVLAKKFAGLVKFPSLEIGVQTNTDLTDRYVDKRISYDGAAMPRAPVTNPFVLFRNVFGSGVAGSSANNQRSDIDKSVLDNAIGDFTRLMPKLSSADQALLDQHATSIRTLESQLTTTYTLDCSQTTAPTPPLGTNGQPLDPSPAGDTLTTAWSMQLANFPAVGAMMQSIMVQAVACGLTNIVTFFWANSENNMSFPWINISTGHHDMSHARAPGLVQIDQWYAGQFNNMITALNAIPESGGTGSILDNTVMMYTSCLSDGSSHHSDNMPITLAGSNGGYFKQGHAIRFNNIFTSNAVADQVQPPAGVPDLSNSDLMVSIINSFEVATDPGKAPTTTFGNPNFCHGALPNVTA